MEKNEKPIAIIGSGISGLSAAINLCKNGIKPVIFEKNPFHGGYATNTREKGFRFEVSLHYTSPLIKIALEKLGLSSKIELIEVKNTSIASCNNTCSRDDFFNNDRAKSFIEVLIRKYPSEEKSIRKFFSIGRDITPMSDDLLLSRSTPALALLKHPRSIPPAGKYLGKTAKQLIDDLFEDENLKRDISGAALVLGTPIESMNSIPYIQAATDQFERGVFYIRGGSQQLVDVMRKTIEKSGGTFRMNSAVSAVTVSEGLADSIAVNSKKLEVNSIINCTDILKFEKMFTPGVKIFKNDISRPIGLNASVVHLGLDFDVKDRGFSACNYAIDTPKISFDIAIYSNIDPSCCRTHNSVVTLTGISKKNFETESMNALAMLIGSDIKDHVVVKKVYTPRTFEDLTWNTNGTYVGFQSDAYNIKNPIPNKTLIPNIFVAGQWTGVGGGYVNTMLSGYNASNELLKTI